MKKWIVFLATILIAMCVCACSSQSVTYTMNKNGITYVVNTESNTISDGTNTYQYSFSGNSSSWKIDIIYPDGSTYWWQSQDSGGVFSNGYGGWSDDYDETRYVDGGTLCDILVEKAPKESNPGKFFVSIFLFAAGAFNAVSPHTAWYLQYGWRYKDAEPSELALRLNRSGGVIAMIVAVILLFISP